MLSFKHKISYKNILWVGINNNIVIEIHILSGEFIIIFNPSAAIFYNHMLF